MWRGTETSGNSHYQPPDLRVNELLDDPNLQSLSLPTRPQKLWNKYKLSLLCPVQIPDSWICEHNKWLFKFLSLGKICYTAMVTGTQCNQGFVDEADSSYIHLYPAEWMWAQLSALESLLYTFVLLLVIGTWCPCSCSQNELVLLLKPKVVSYIHTPRALSVL